MATSALPVDVQRVNVTAVGVVQADPPPYDNTHTVEIYNRGATAIRFTFGDPTGLLPDYGGITVAPGAAYRCPLGTAAFRPGGRFALGTYNLIFNGAVANPDIEVHYFNGAGPVQP
jgi:hypothetical protein